MKGPRVHTLPQCVYASADDIPVRENTRGNPKESRTLGRSGEGLAPPRCSCLESRVSQMNEAIKKEAFVVRLHQTLLGPAALNRLSGLGLFSFGPRRLGKGQSSCCMTELHCYYPHPAITLPHSDQAYVGGTQQWRGLISFMWSLRHLPVGWGSLSGQIRRV